MQTEQATDRVVRESAGYFAVAGADLYTVLHEVADPIARVLLIGPFASERHNSYLPWVRWARYLAARRIEVLRYDYRGIGESTGVFEKLTFTDWAQDVQLLSGWLQSRSPDVPLVLHGLEVGGLLAGNAFHHGIGDAALLWSPPSSARQALRTTLMRWVGLEYLYRPAEEVKSAAQYTAILESGDPIEVEGYQWSSRLWCDSHLLQLPSPMVSSDTAAAHYRKPICITKLGRQAAPLVKGGFVGYDEAKDFDWLFAPNADWIAASAASLNSSIRGGNHEIGD